MSYVFESLRFFKQVFSHRSTRLMFCIVALGFIGTDELVGVTSFCRFRGFGEKACNALLRFFRYSVRSSEMLVFQRAALVLSENETVMVQGRAVLPGDHTYAAEDGRRTAGAVSLRRNPETQSKPSYFRGHCRGAAGLLTGSSEAPFCLPLHLSIRQGAAKTNPKQGRYAPSTGIVTTAADSALKHDIPSVLAPDAFFPGADVFGPAASVYPAEIRQPPITLIIRAKNNCAAYFGPVPAEGGRPGRPRKYGMKVKLTEVSGHPHLFSTRECAVCGKIGEISVTAPGLLRKPAGSLIRFVPAATGRGPVVPMCSCLNRAPLSAAGLYCSGIRIETVSDMLKNATGAFGCRFGSELMPRHSRNPVKNKNPIQPASKYVSKARQRRQACERFVMPGAVFPGILQMTALRYTDMIRGHYDAYLRTRSCDLPSERTVRYVLPYCS